VVVQKTAKSSKQVGKGKEDSNFSDALDMKGTIHEVFAIAVY
jgi:hypothetical protein